MKVDMLFRTMAEDGIVPNSATYAVLLYNYAKYARCMQGSSDVYTSSRTDNMSAIEVDHLITEMESKVCSSTDVTDIKLFYIIGAQA